MEHYLFDSPHWQVSGVHDLPRFFRALTDLVPAGSFLTLADGAWNAEPEVAMHLAVWTAEDRVLEWFDLPDDPLAVSFAITEARLQRFCDATGSSYRRMGGTPS